ncbi:MAG: hypothetical protein ACD_15C00212G0014 [uncultured bacterium]|nr:MAG: hypothetical protein ACD_15C00212G0014 [uncultured bacterium]HCU71127.1 hypothetical protein [Candidatus Moranbacteria bacterium]
MSIIFSNKYFLRIVCLILAVKVLLLFWSSHPFDFWAFVNQFQRDSLYGWSFFDGWNKGNLLYVIWYPMYGVYLKSMEIFSLNFDSVLLLHFFFKIPFLFIDLLTGFLIFKSIFILSNDYIKARAGFLVWFINPLIFLVYGVHGHYEIITSFGLSLVIFGLLRRKAWLVGVGLVIGFVVKYFIVIFCPFIMLYFVSRREYKHMAVMTFVFVLGVTVSYVHLLNDPALIGQTFNSIVKLSQAHSSSVVNEVNIKPLSIASSINYIFNPNDPITNINNTSVFNLATKGGIIFILTIWVLHICWRFYSIIYKKNKYNLNLVIIDIFASILYFLLFMTNFQKHYLAWIIPFLIIFFYKKLAWGWIFITITVTGFMYAFKSEYGPRTFFLDVFYLKDPTSLNNVSMRSMYMFGFIIILMIIFSLFLLIIDKKNRIKDTGNHILVFYCSFVSICWFFLILINTQIIWNYYLKEDKPMYLAYTNGVLHRGIMYGNFEVSKALDNEIIFKQNSKNNILILNKLENISGDYYNAYIIIKNINKTDDIREVLKSSFLNEKCEMLNYKDNIKNYNDRLDYSGFEISTSCLNNYENKLVLKNTGEIKKSDIELFISNKKVDFLYNKKLSRFIMAQATVGLLMIFIAIYIAFVVIKRMLRN